MPLADLVDDVPRILEHWPTRPTLHHRSPRALAALWSLAEVNALVDSECLPARNVVLLKDGKVLERHTYTEASGDMPRPEPCGHISTAAAPSPSVSSRRSSRP
ncbi:cupin 4 family protein [Streptomyces laurentii]|uniref:Cupin 4 family protein n=1 Tax=Streptomyces laurentii TaxID=39478 RepID=A0A169NE17_STRLU|nr:cupin 4 family protein [Streptomyces laurentii]